MQELAFLRDRVRELWAAAGEAGAPPRRRAAFLRRAVLAQGYSPQLHAHLKAAAVDGMARAYRATAVGAAAAAAAAAAGLPVERPRRGTAPAGVPAPPPSVAAR